MKYNKSDPLFTISIASKLTGLHPRTLMLYEKAGLVKPFRTKTDRRIYSQTNLNKIKFINYLTSEKKVNLAGIKLIFNIINLTEEFDPKIVSNFFPNFKL